MPRLSRRSLLARLAAAAVAAPVLAVTATRPAEAAPDAVADARAEGYRRGYDVAEARAKNRLQVQQWLREGCHDGELAEIGRVKALLDDYYRSEQGMADVMQQAREYMGEFRMEPGSVQVMTGRLVRYG